MILQLSKKAKIYAIHWAALDHLPSWVHFMTIMDFLAMSMSDAGKLGGNLIGSGGERGGSNKDKGVAGS